MNDPKPQPPIYDGEIGEIVLMQMALYFRKLREWEERQEMKRMIQRLMPVPQVPSTWWVTGRKPYE